MPEGPRPPADVLLVQRPEQLKALGHPLRLRILELLGGSEGPLTNRELAQRLLVDPGHLHFHVRMLLRAGLIELAEGGRGREKPYRPVARTVRVPPDLLPLGLTADVQSAMLEQVERGWAAFGALGLFRSAQLTVRLPIDRGLELIAEFVERVRDLEDPQAEPLMITAVVHPPPEATTGGAES